MIVIRWSKLTSVVIHISCLLMYTLRTQDHFHGLSAPNASSNFEKVLNKPKLEDSLQNNWPILFKDVIVMKPWEGQRNWLTLKQTKDMTTKCNMWSRVGPCYRKKYYKRYYWDNHQNLIMVSRLDDGFVSTLNFLILITALWLCKRVFCS